MIKIGELFDIEKGSVQSSKCIEGEYDFITASGEWKTHNEYTHDCEALIFAMGASGSLGRTHYVKGKFVSSDLCFILTPKEKYKAELNLRFYYYYFNTFREKIVKVTATGTSKLAINRKIFSNYKIHFIDIDKQTALIDKIEEMQVFSKKLLTEVERQENCISSLRQSILQQAVEGKLCEQDPNDEPASVLLEKIKAEKLAICKSKKEISYFENEFSKVKIDNNTLFITAELICDYITKGTTPKTDELLDNGEIPYLKVYNIVNNKIDFFYRAQYVSKETHNNFLTRSKVYPSDVLTNIVGPPLGKVAIVPSNFDEWNINQAIAIFRALSNVLPQYLYLVLLEGKAINKIVTVGTAGQDNISLAQCRNIIIPLPLLAKQQRIVEKVGRLMALCDQLEQEVSNAKKYSSQLMEAVLQEAFNGAKDKQNNVFEFSLKPQEKKEELLAAARGKLRQDTWENLRKRALELAGEES